MKGARERVPSYLALSMFNLTCCCLPLGIAAVIFSLEARYASREGNFELASKFSRKARRMNIIGIVLGVILLIISIAVLVVLAVILYRYRRIVLPAISAAASKLIQHILKEM